jgi:hypothetical protein
LGVRSVLTTLRFLAAFLALSSCADSRGPVPAELLGVWVLSEASARNFPSECRHLQLEFTSNGRLVSKSGDLIFVTKVSISRRNGGFVVHHEIAEHNDKPNCQGKSAYYVLSNFVYESYFERDGAVLREYLRTKKSGRFVEFVRAN